MRTAMLTLALLVGVVGPVLAASSGVLPGGDALWPLSWLAWAPAGYLILLKRPNNRVGVALLLVGGTMGLSFVALAMTAWEALSLRTRVWIELVNVVFGVVPWLAVVWLVLVFPTGMYRSRAERLTAWAVVAVTLLASAAFAVSPMPMAETGLASPLAIPALGTASTFITHGPGFFMVITLLIAALALMVRRWRRSSGLERAQFRWLFFGAALFLSVLIIGQFVPEDSGALYLWIPGGVAIPVTIGVAVLRYRLYEIDRIISRTVGYGVVVALLALVVLGLVAGLALFLPSDDPLVVAVATLAVFVLFNPLREGVQRVVDRRFNRSRYDAERVIDEFAGSLRDEVDPDDVVDGWLDLVSQTMQPASLGIWVRG